MGLANVVLVMGKGGVGKTTVADGIAEGLAQRGLRTLLVELGTGSSVRARSHGATAARAQRQTISEEAALIETASEVFGSARVAKMLFGHFSIKRLVSVVPGVREYCLVVAARKRLAEYERVVIDMPATGHGISWLSAAAQLSRLVPHGRARVQADALDAALRDPHQTSYVLVTLPEPMVLAESDELERALSTRLGVRVHHTVLNRVPADACLAEADAHALARSDPGMRSPLDELLAWARERSYALAHVKALLARGHATLLPESHGAPSAAAVQRALLLGGALS